ncbi:hypothetical protein APY03_3959 [Variovorax sp. WDL1]|nr:hypothetical protein APY03_3959 [Variovorax sp. WDL1]
MIHSRIVVEPCGDARHRRSSSPSRFARLRLDRSVQRRGE